jgi:voltage-gated sodium channel
LTVVEIDDKASGRATKAWVKTVDLLMIGFYVLELVLRFVVMRLQLLEDPYSLMDVVLLFVDVALADSKMVLLRFLRVTRVARMSHLFKVVPELHLMMKGLSGAVMAILWGSVLIFILVLVWAVLAVTLIHPIARRIATSPDGSERCFACDDAYKNVFKAFLTIVQTVVCGDDWGSTALPIIEEEPWSGLYFYIVFASIVMAATNLILAVIVDAAQEARKDSSSVNATILRMQEMKELRMSLAEKIGLTGKNGLTAEDLRRGYHDIPEFGNSLKVLGIDDADIDQLFAVMDMDGSGMVTRDEFLKECLQLQCSDVRSLFLHTRIAMSTMNQRFENRISTLLSEIREVQQEVLSNVRSRARDTVEPGDSCIDRITTRITTFDNDIVRASKGSNTVDINFSTVSVIEKDIEELSAKFGEVNNTWTEACQQRHINEVCQQLLTKLSNISSACGVEVQALEALIEDHHTKYTCMRPNFHMPPTPFKPLKAMFDATELLAMNASSVRPLRGSAVPV